MTTQSIGGGLQAGLLQRLFAKADQDQNQSVSAAELASLMSGKDTATRAAAIVVNRDLDSDGQLTMAELSTGKLAPETLSGLLSRQEYVAADRGGRLADDRNAVDDFFTQADSDGDGKLSKDELDAERTLRMARSLDDGEAAPQHMFGAMRGAADDGVITKDELLVGRRLIDIAKAVSADDPHLDPELAKRLPTLQRLKEDAETPQGPPEDTTTVLSNAVRSAELTQTLISRLLRQLELPRSSGSAQDLTA